MGSVGIMKMIENSSTFHFDFIGEISLNLSEYRAYFNRKIYFFNILNGGKLT